LFKYDYMLQSKKTTRDANAPKKVVEKLFTLEQATKAPALDGMGGERHVSAVFPREKAVAIV
jgi:hypothetical protein